MTGTGVGREEWLGLPSRRVPGREPGGALQVRRAPTVLVFALIVALLAALTSTTLLLVEQFRSSAERDAVTAAMDLVDALNTGDRAALAEVTTENVVWSAIGNGDVVGGPERGDDYLDFQTGSGASAWLPARAAAASRELTAHRAVRR
jgi:hypothetical protein